MHESDVEDADEVSRGLAKALRQQSRAILGDTVELKASKTSRELATPEGAYVGRLGTESGETAWIVLQVEAAIAAAGLMLQRPASSIEESIAAKKLEGDDLDALGEFVNQLTAPLNTTLEEGRGRTLHFTFKQGTVDGSQIPSTDGMLVVELAFDGGGDGKGSLYVVVPYDGVIPAVAEESAEEGAGGVALELTAEEVAALREATREAAQSAALGKALVIVPIAREHAAWEELLQAAGLAHVLATSVLERLAAIRSGEFDFIIVDADTSAAGGLSMLARLKNAAPRVPTVVVASTPTRSHLVSCLAAGAHHYLAKPIDFATLNELLGAA